MKRTTLTAGAVAIGLLFASAALHAQDGAADSTTDPRWTWDLTELYGSDDEWAAGLEEALAGLENLRALKGTLADGPEALLGRVSTLTPASAPTRTWAIRAARSVASRRSECIASTSRPVPGFSLS